MTNNKKIALFMGYSESPYAHLPNKVYKENQDGDIMGTSIDHLYYDTSWDALIPVIIELNNREHKPELRKRFNHKLEIIEIDLGRHMDIKKTYEQVIEAIDVFNS